MTKLISFCFLFSFLSCHSDKLIPEPDGYACGKVISKRYLAINAPVAYSKAINSYYIESIILDVPRSTIDSTVSREISVFCNLPDEYKMVGKMIKFDGSFAQLNDTTGVEGLIKKTFNTRLANYLSIDKIY